MEDSSFDHFSFEYMAVVEERFCGPKEERAFGDKNLGQAVEEAVFKCLVKVNGDIPAKDKVESAEGGKVVLEVEPFKSDAFANVFDDRPRIVRRGDKVIGAPVGMEAAGDFYLVLARVGGKHQGAG